MSKLNWKYPRMTTNTEHSTHKVPNKSLITGNAIQKHAYSNILKILQPKKENFQIKKTQIFFHIPAQNIDCGYSLELPQWGSSNEYPQSMFWAEIRKIMYTPVNPSFTIEKWGWKRSILHRRVFVMDYIDQHFNNLYFLKKTTSTLECHLPQFWMTL